MVVLGYSVVREEYRGYPLGEKVGHGRILGMSINK